MTEQKQPQDIVTTEISLEVSPTLVADLAKIADHLGLSLELAATGAITAGLVTLQEVARRQRTELTIFPERANRRKEHR